MRRSPATVNLRPLNVLQFESVAEASQSLPEHLILSWINTCFKNTQCIKFADALREASRGK